MSKESYVRGFCKAAEAHGVDPEALAKYAASAAPETSEEIARSFAGVMNDDPFKEEGPGFWERAAKAIRAAAQKSRSAARASMAASGRAASNATNDIYRAVSKALGASTNAADRASSASKGAYTAATNNTAKAVGDLLDASKDAYTAATNAGARVIGRIPKWTPSAKK